MTFDALSLNTGLTLKHVHWYTLPHRMKSTEPLICDWLLLPLSWGSLFCHITELIKLTLPDIEQRYPWHSVWALCGLWFIADQNRIWMKDRMRRWLQSTFEKSCCFSKCCILNAVCQSELNYPSIFRLFLILSSQPISLFPDLIHFSMCSILYREKKTKSRNLYFPRQNFLL